MLTNIEHICMFEQMNSSMFEHIRLCGFTRIPCLRQWSASDEHGEHNDLARDLAEGIASGPLPGRALCCRPSSSCASDYGASRYTVRMALGELQELGLISRRKNVGTRVEAARPTAGLHAVARDGGRAGAVRRRARARRARGRGGGGRPGAGARSWAAPAARAGCASRACAWTAAESAGRSAGPMSTSMRPIAEIGDLVRESPETLISSLIEARYGRAHRAHPAGHPRDCACRRRWPPSCSRARFPALKIVRRYFDCGRRGVRDLGHLHPADRFNFRHGDDPFASLGGRDTQRLSHCSAGFPRSTLQCAFAAPRHLSAIGDAL